MANLFSSLGAPVIDADELSRQVVATGKPAYEEILQHFGTSVLGESGELDRRRLRERIFSDSAKRDRLEAIVHPRVFAQMELLLDCLEAPYAIVVVPLLIESGASGQVDRVLVVDTPEDLQIERTRNRDGLSDLSCRPDLRHRCGAGILKASRILSRGCQCVPA